MLRSATQPGTAACTETGIRPNPIAWGPVTHGDVGRPRRIDDEEQRFQTTQMAKVVHRTRLDRHPEATRPNCGGRTTASSDTGGRGRETTSKRRPNERSEAGVQREQNQHKHRPEQVTTSPRPANRCINIPSHNRNKRNTTATHHSSRPHTQPGGPKNTGDRSSRRGVGSPHGCVRGWVGLGYGTGRGGALAGVTWSSSTTGRGGTGRARGKGCQASRCQVSR